MFEVKNNIFEMEIMMNVRIIIDSASDLTKEQADKLGLDFLPLKTIFGTEEYLDGITLSHQQFYEKLIECGTIPTTSQVSPHDFEAKFKEVKEAGDTAVVICLSSLLSGTYCVRIKKGGGDTTPSPRLNMIRFSVLVTHHPRRETPLRW